MKTKFYITTPIYYPSAKAHIGHAYTTVVADVLARYKRMRGFATYYLTGTDEHGEKIQNNAKLAGKSEQQFVDDIANDFKKLWKTLEISNDDFIRTTEDRHTKVVKSIFTKLYNQGDIYLGKYEGWYCTPCESFWTETQVGPERLCPDCHRPVHTASEDAYFFKTRKYVDQLLKIMDDNPKFLLPINRKNEMINTFIKPGLEDLCVSRTSFNWGIATNEDPRHVVYVWLDALSNYITALGYDSDNPELFNKFWADENSEIVHLMGADISRFHAIYWPMFLMGLGVRVPDRLFVHGLLMMKDGKMSKSKGNVVSPYPLIERYGVDAVRYYLTREVVFGSDGQFTPEQFVERINNDLANDFGNLLNRTLAMINKYFEGVVPTYDGDVTPFDKDLRTLSEETVRGYEEDLDDLKITDAFSKVNNLVAKANKYIDDTAPWALNKDESRRGELASVMSHLANVLFVAGMLFKPILVHASEKLFDQLGLNEKQRVYENVRKFGCVANIKINKGDPLFPRLDSAIEVPYIQELMK